MSTAHIDPASLNLPWLENVWVQASLALLLLVTSAWLANWIAKRIVLKAIVKLLERSPLDIEAPHIGAIVARLANILPTLIVQAGISTVPALPPW